MLKKFSPKSAFCPAGYPSICLSVQCTLLARSSALTFGPSRLQETEAELGSLLKVKGHQLDEATATMAKMKTSLDCSWTLLQKSQSPLLGELDTECHMSSRAQLLLAVSDQAVEEDKRKVGKGRKKGGHGSQVRRARFITAHCHNVQQAKVQLSGALH